MPCSDSSSSMTLRLDHEGRLLKFDYAKITCGRSISGESAYSQFCHGKTLEEILKIEFSPLAAALAVDKEEEQFILYLEWDVLRCAIAEYLGVDLPDLDRERSKITSVVSDDSGVEIAQVILPPKSLPKILPCSLADNG